MVVFGVIANVSIIRLFIGGIIPGLILGPGPTTIGRDFHVRGKQRYHVEGKFSTIAVIKACWEAFGALMLPVIILGGILLGICTATEAAVISAVYAFTRSAFIYRELKVKDFLPVLVNTCRGTAVVLLVCGAAMAAAYFITTAQIPEMMAKSSCSSSRAATGVLFMFWVNILLLIVGCVMDLTPALLILGPMLLPIAAQYDLDRLFRGCHRESVRRAHHAAGRQHPFVACGLSKISVAEIGRAIWPNIVIGIIVISS